ncbi:hypothetical protein EJB05_25648 [Eragrostis curvula]|uniref:Uncharacterized protein n=1 Tax=Eragrostis curvula TaxID=38414 RepID=A0A5J9UHZ1_9POAL|nr:hypothetical protein EJB05_25648 [Eragrostis curvula]
MRCFHVISVVVGLADRLFFNLPCDELSLKFSNAGTSHQHHFLSQDLSDFFVDVDMQGCIPPVGVISYVFPYL